MTRREIHEPIASGPGDGLAFGIFFALLDPETEQADVGNTENELAQMRDDIEALVGHGYRVIVDPAADAATLAAYLAGTHPDMRGARPAGLLWSSHGSDDGQVQTATGEWLSYRHIDPRSVDAALRTVIFSACHVGRWSSYWSQAFGGARVYGWGKPVGFSRAESFYDPTSSSSVRLDRILERDLDLRKGSVLEIHRALSGAGGLPNDDPAAAIVAAATPYLRVGCNGPPLFDPAAQRVLVDLRFGDGRHQRLSIRLVDPSPAYRAHVGDAPMLCIESLVGPFPEDGFDAHDDVEVDEVGVHFALRDTHFARVQIEGAPTESIVAQACLPQSVHPAVVALAIDEVGTLADVLEAEIFGADRR